jgi:tRNA A37 methylthiotransferase MiaB
MYSHCIFRDDVPPEVKNRRLQEVIAKFNIHALSNNSKEIGKQHLVLVDGVTMAIRILFTH